MEGHLGRRRAASPFPAERYLGPLHPRVGGGAHPAVICLAGWLWSGIVFFIVPRNPCGAPRGGRRLWRGGRPARTVWRLAHANQRFPQPPSWAANRCIVGGVCRIGV